MARVYMKKCYQKFALHSCRYRTTLYAKNVENEILCILR